MIQDLLDATRAEAGKLSVDLSSVPLQDAVADVVRTLQARAHELGISLEYETSEPLPPVLADPARIRQILINLIDNALKFTPRGGRVTVRTSRHDPGHAQVSVSDTGKGIPPDVKERLFERLFQGPRDSAVSRQGLGLGLFICRELVTLQGGRIAVESESGRAARPREQRERSLALGFRATHEQRPTREAVAPFVCILLCGARVKLCRHVSPVPLRCPWKSYPANAMTPHAVETAAKSRSSRAARGDCDDFAAMRTSSQCPGVIRGTPRCRRGRYSSSATRVSPDAVG